MAIDLLHFQKTIEMIKPIAWLIDTNVISEMMKPHPEQRVVGLLDSIGDGLGLSSFPVWEILNQIGKMDSGKRRDEKADRFQTILDVLFEDRIIDWSVTHALECAKIMKEKRRIGEALDDHLPGAFLVAVAKCHDLSLITRNTRDFRNTGVVTLNPWQD